MGASSNLNTTSLHGNGKKKNGKQKRHEEPHSTGIVARRTYARNAARMAKFNSNFRRTLENTVVNKYASRRTSLFKSSRPMKAPKRRATVRTHQQLYDQEGRLFRVGDIVSLLDEEDGMPYFAQIRGLVTDSYGDQKVALNWLIPLKSASDEHYFDPNHFAHGISDPEFYSINDCCFICNAPDLPAYRKEWTPRECAEEQLKYEMEERLRDLQAVASSELRFLDGSLVKKCKK
uniref:BAH domain-containing protein n=1 Tax=Syphacia muris TaxID=451379 RepID=A0A0N5AKU5_9BILA